MKMNGWSIVKSPIGVSLRPLVGGVPGSGEICVDMDQSTGVISITVHADGYDLPVSEMRVPVWAVKAVEKTT